MNRSMRLFTAAGAFAAAMQFPFPHEADLLRGQTAPQSSQFQVDPFWPKALPNDWVTGNVGGTCVDKNDHVFIVTRTADPANLTPAEKEVGRAAPPGIEFHPDAGEKRGRPGRAAGDRVRPRRQRGQLLGRSENLPERRA